MKSDYIAGKIKKLQQHRQPDRMKLTKTEKIMFPELRAAMRRSRLIAKARIGDCDPATYAVRVQRLFTVGLKTFLNPNRSKA